MRIITGTARGVRLKTLEGDTTRPTSERAKEAVFSMLQFELEGRRILDLYGGSGQLALEALSRGASFADIVDSSKEAAEVIRSNIQSTKMEKQCLLHCQEDFAFLRSRGITQAPGYDIIFLDPPYRLQRIPEALRLLRENGCIKPTTIVVCESAEKDLFSTKEDERAFWTERRKAQYGVATVTLLIPKERGESVL